MAKILFPNSSAVAVVLIEAGEPFYVRRMIPSDIGEVADVNGGDQVVPRIAIVAVVEGLDADGRGAFHMRFARAARADAGHLAFVKPEPWPLARRALQHAKVASAHALGGFRGAVAYSDEIAIPDYNMSGSRGWILRRSEVQSYIKALPPIVDSGRLASVWVHASGFINTPDECAILVRHEDPAVTGEPAPRYYDRPRGEYVSFNQWLFRVDYDAGSLRVKKITELLPIPQKECATVPYRVRPVQRDIVVGRRLPEELRRVRELAS